MTTSSFVDPVIDSATHWRVESFVGDYTTVNLHTHGCVDLVHWISSLATIHENLYVPIWRTVRRDVQERLRTI